MRHEGAHQLLDRLLETCKARGWIKTRGKQRTDYDACVAAIRTLNRLELVLETLRAALNQLSEADARWVRGAVPLEWYELYGPRAESYRLPKSGANAMLVQIGADGYALMDAIYGDDAQPLRCLPDLEVLRCIWIRQYSRCSEAGLEEVRWRQNNEEPLRQPCGFSRPMTSMCATAQRDTEWVGWGASERACDAGPSRSDRTSAHDVVDHARLRHGSPSNRS